MISNYFATWACVFMVVFVVLYKFWFIAEWQNLRIKHKLVNDRRESPPRWSNEITGSRCYFLPHKLKLAGYSFVSSSGITLAQMYVMKNKPINSMDDVVQILLGIGLNLGLILGITKANDKSDSDVWIMRIVALIRDKGLLPIVLKERQDYLEFIHKQITCWHKHDSNDKDTHFVGLIIRIHTDFFAEIVSATTVEENESSDELFLRKEKLKDLPQKIIRDYHFGDQNMTVLAQVKQLFNEYLDIANSEMFKVISFIKEHEQCCQGKIKARLKAQIESRVTPPRQKQTSAIDAAKLVQKLLFSMREVSATEEDRDGSLQS